MLLESPDLTGCFSRSDQDTIMSTLSSSLPFRARLVSQCLVIMISRPVPVYHLEGCEEEVRCGGPLQMPSRGPPCGVPIHARHDIYRTPRREGRCFRY